jgi:putative cell wall-binding protein
LSIKSRPVAGALLSVLLALAALTPVAPAGALPDFAFERLAGKDRFDTARVISRELGRSETVIVARGDVFADALAGTFLAGVNQAPVLLTRSDGLPAETDAAIDAAGAKRVLLLGGTSAISPAVEAHLRGKGLAVERIGGVDRFETASLVARQGGPGVLGTSDGLRTAIVVSGANFPDALSGGPVSYSQKFPTLLTAPGAASPAMLAALDALEIRQVIIIGGPTAVAAPVESAIRSRGLNVNRLFGQDRSGTSVAVGRIAVERFGLSPRHINVARGDHFADALAFSAHAGRDPKVNGPAPLMLTISSTVAGKELVEAVRAQSGSLEHGHIAGGLSALSQEVEDELTRAARGGSSDLELDYSSVVPGGTVRGEVRGDSIGTISVSGCGLRGLDVRQGAGAFEFTLPESTQPGTCSLVFTTNFTDGSPAETDRRTITVEERTSTGNPPGTTPTTQPGGSTPTTQPNGSTPTTQPGGGTTPTTQPNGSTPTTQPGSGGSTPTTQPEGGGGGSPTTQPGSGGGSTPTTQPGNGNGSAPTTQPQPTTTTTQPAPTTTTTQPPPTTTTQPPPASTIQRAVADDAGGGNADAADIHQLTFTGPAHATLDDEGSSYVITDTDGNSGEVTCGTNAVCFFVPAGTYGTSTVAANQVLRVRLLATPRKLAGDAPIAYPVTLTRHSGWKMQDGSTVELGGASLALGVLSPTRTTGFPVLNSATEASGSAIRLDFGRDIGIACGGSSDYLRQVALETGTGTHQPVSITGGSTVTLKFPDGTVLLNGASDGEILYGDSTSAVPDCGDLIDLSGNAVRNFGPVATVEP